MQGELYLANADVITEPLIYRTMRFLTMFEKGSWVGSFFEASFLASLRVLRTDPLCAGQACLSIFEYLWIVALSFLFDFLLPL